jgi:hypothetical protein
MALHRVVEIAVDHRAHRLGPSGVGGESRPSRIRGRLPPGIRNKAGVLTRVCSQGRPIVFNGSSQVVAIFSGNVN